MIPRYTSADMGALRTEQARFEAMLEVELCVLEAQGAIGMVPKSAAPAVRKKAKINVKRINAIEKRTNHDVIAFIESIEEQVPQYGRYLHFGLTSSDVLDTALGYLMKQATLILIDDLKTFNKALASQARKHRKTLTIGRTHGVHAEPTTFGMKLAVFYDEFKRHEQRLKDALVEISVGSISGAVGTFASLPPNIERAVCRKLGIKPAPIATQVIQRERHAAYLNTIALIGASLEKLAVEIRHLQRSEVREAEEPFGKGQKGSSAMPHKKNPITCERVTGLSRVLRGNAMAALENVALWHERDISHSSVERVILPDSTIILNNMLRSMTRIMSGLVVHKDRMKANLNSTGGVVYSGQVLLALMKQGLTRTKAYEMVQRCALKAWHENGELIDMLVDDEEIGKYLSPEELKKILDPKNHLKHIDTIFKRVGL